MLTLLAFLKTFDSDAAREAFATRCGTTLGHLKNVSYSYRPCSTELAVAIERESAQQVLRETVCPDNWRERWPELVQLNRTAATA